MRRTTFWKPCSLCSIGLAIAAFSLLVIPTQRVTPLILGVRRTLWAGILVSVGLAILTILGAWGVRRGRQAYVTVIKAVSGTGRFEGVKNCGGHHA